MITGIHINYYFVCHRKLWLFMHGLQMEHSSDIVYEGKLIHEPSYRQRASRYQEVELPGIKIDYYAAYNKVIHEVKKSNQIEEAHIWQLKFYIYCLQQAGVEGVTGVLEYPKLRQKETITYESNDEAAIKTMMAKIYKIKELEACPDVINKSLCKRCSYYEFCYVTET